MIDLNNKAVVIDGERVATLAVEGNIVYVTKLPACSLGTYFLILTWLFELGYLVV